MFTFQWTAREAGGFDCLMPELGFNYEVSVFQPEDSHEWRWRLQRGDNTRLVGPLFHRPETASADAERVCNALFAMLEAEHWYTTYIGNAEGKMQNPPPFHNDTP